MQDAIRPGVIVKSRSFSDYKDCRVIYFIDKEDYCYFVNFDDQRGLFYNPTRSAVSKTQTRTAYNVVGYLSDNELEQLQDIMVYLRKCFNKAFAEAESKFDNFLSEQRMDELFK